MTETTAGLVRLGVTGHRFLPAAPQRRARLWERVGEILREIGATTALLEVLSPLAEGADRLVAEVALDLTTAVPAKVHLVCALPFPVDLYRLDFHTPASRDAFDALLARATSVVELAGRRRRPGAMADDPDLLKDAYAAVGAYVVDHADVLLALWDGEPARGRGGTGEVVALARARGVPVRHVDLRRPR